MHQDWNPVVFTKKTKHTPEEAAAAAAAGTVDHYERRKAHKLDAHTGEGVEDSSSAKQKAKQFRTFFTSYRIQHKMTQKEFATKLNLKPDVVANIENGKTTPDPSLVQRIKNRLQTLSS